MATAVGGYVNQEQLAKQVQLASRKLGEDVVHVKYNVETDTSGEPAIYFRIVLTDAASSDDKTLGEVTAKVSRILFEELHPYENWGLRAYFRFRSYSEQAKQHDLAWA